MRKIERRSPRAAGATAPKGDPRPLSWAWSAALAAAMLVIYLLLAPHFTADEDAAEITMGLATGGVLHPSGYPLFTLLGHGFLSVLRGLGVGYAFAANAWSALGAGCAMLFLHRLALRLLAPAPLRSRGMRMALAATPVLLFGFHSQWLAEATLVEVHSWHLAWLCGTTLFFVATLQSWSSNAPPRRLGARMLLWGALCGVGLAHHETSALWSGTYTIALALALVHAKAFRPWVPLAWLAGGLAVVLPAYGWMFLRVQHPGSASIWPTLEPGWRGLFDHLTGALYRGYLGHWNPDPEQASLLVHDIAPVLVPCVVLLTVMVVRARVHALALRSILVGCGLQLFFVSRYGVPDPISYFLPALAMATLGLLVLPQFSAMRSGALPRLATAVAALALAALAFLGLREALDRNDGLALYDRNIRSMWHAIPYEHAIFLWPADTYYKVELYQRFEGDKPAIEVDNPEILCNPYPAARFRERHGFDPLANNDPAHARDSISPKFLVAGLTAWAPRYVGRLMETIADSARVPVLLFDNRSLKPLNGRRTAG